MQIATHHWHTTIHTTIIKKLVLCRLNDYFQINISLIQHSFYTYKPRTNLVCFKWIRLECVPFSLEHLNIINAIYVDVSNKFDRFNLVHLLNKPKLYFSPFYRGYKAPEVSENRTSEVKFTRNLFCSMKLVFKL